MKNSDTPNVRDYQKVTERQRTMWASGDFNVIALETMAASEDLVQAVDPHAGQRVLDIACGSGNTALVTARRHCEVAGIDYVPELIERATMRAAAEGVDIDFRVGDAQQLPFPDASFDVVVSVFGVMFAPDQEKAASELLRVCRPGGTIGLSSWMPEAFGRDFFAAHAKYAPPPPGAKPPARWGTDAGLAELLGDDIISIENQRHSIFAYFRSIDHAVDLHCTYFGPTIRILRAAEPSTQANIRKDLSDVFTRYNRATDGTAIIEFEYLQTIATRA